MIGVRSITDEPEADTGRVSYSVDGINEVAVKTMNDIDPGKIGDVIMEGLYGTTEVISSGRNIGDDLEDSGRGQVEMIIARSEAEPEDV